MLLGRTITLDTLRVFSMTTAYMQNDRTWCVSLAKPMPLWLNMWHIASEPIWCLAFVTVYLEGLILYMFMRYERGHPGFMKKDFHYCLLLMSMIAFTGMPHMKYHPKSKRLRLFIAFILMSGILISIAWNCFLVKVITSPNHNEQISTVSEILERNFRLIGLYNGKELMMMQPEKVMKSPKHCNDTSIEYFAPFYSQYPNDTEYHGYADVDSCLEQLKWDDHVAVSISRLRAHNCERIRYSEMHCFSISENIYTYSQALRTAKKYEFLPYINLMIRRCLEVGLIDKWHRDSSMYRNDPKLKLDRRISLSVTHIGAALLLLFCGLSIATLVFFVERIVFRNTKERNCHPFWLLLSRFVDGRRFYLLVKPLKRKVLFVQKNHLRSRRPKY